MEVIKKRLLRALKGTEQMSIVGIGLGQVDHQRILRRDRLGRRIERPGDDASSLCDYMLSERSFCLSNTVNHLGGVKYGFGRAAVNLDHVETGLFLHIKDLQLVPFEIKFCAHSSISTVFILKY